MLARKPLPEDQISLFLRDQAGGIPHRGLVPQVLKGVLSLQLLPNRTKIVVVSLTEHVWGVDVYNEGDIDFQVSDDKIRVQLPNIETIIISDYDNK